MVLYQSNDNGALYPRDAIDVPEDTVRWTAINVDEPVVLTAEECCGGDGNIVELLIRAGKARMVEKED